MKEDRVVKVIQLPRRTNLPLTDISVAPRTCVRTTRQRQKEIETTRDRKKRKKKGERLIRHREKRYFHEGVRKAFEMDGGNRTRHAVCVHVPA